jgi:HK97 gp10 family phage protein
MPNHFIQVDFSGLRAAINNIDQWHDEKIQAVKDVINESALNIQREAKRRTSPNVDTGRLRASIAIEPASTDGMSLKVGTNVEYAPYVEWGTGIYATHPSIPGRRTPWAFPVSAAGRKQYNWPIIEINGEPHYVTRGAKPHPFLFPAAEQERPNYYRNMEEALRNG